MKKRILSLMLVFCMVFTMVPISALATESMSPIGISYVPDSGEPAACPHTYHNENCGFSEGKPAVAQSECTYTHEHNEVCGYEEGTVEIPCDKACEGEHAQDCTFAPETLGTDCTDSHVHDDICGYRVGSEQIAGTDCTHECEYCTDNTPEPPNQDCICDSIIANEGEHTDKNCPFFVEKPVVECNCEGKCALADEENGIVQSINRDCPVCGVYEADFILCNGTEAVMMGAEKGVEKGVSEQFDLPMGKTYYFDLSGELGEVTNGVSDKIGKINAGRYALTVEGNKVGLPDGTLSYVPFTYVGTVNAYSLEDSDKDIPTTEDRANQLKSNRSLFVSDYVVSYGHAWSSLHFRGDLIFGKSFDTIYVLRSLSAGSAKENDASDDLGGTPTSNEWDSILKKDSSFIKNWQDIYSWGQDTYFQNDNNYRTKRGYVSAYKLSNGHTTTTYTNTGWRPALEVADFVPENALEGVELDLNGGHLGTDTSVTSMNIVCIGDTYKAPSVEALTAPVGKEFDKWQDTDDASTTYQPGETVASTVTNLTAQWKVIEQFNLTNGETFYFDLSGELGVVSEGVSDKIGKINAGENAITVDGNKVGLPDASLKYVPFTYVGTVDGYNLEIDDKGTATTEARANELKSTRSLFVSNYNVSHSKSWNDLNTRNLIFGKNFGTNYKLRSLSAGSAGENNPLDKLGGTPASNEWDSILEKDSSYIKNWEKIYSFGQDTAEQDSRERVIRGFHSDAYYNSHSTSVFGPAYGWRPVLEVSKTLSNDDLKTITLNLNGAHLGTDTSVTSMNIVYSGETFKAPDGQSLATPPGTVFDKWQNTANSKITYEAGEDVPNNVTGLTARWKAIEKFALPTGRTYYFDLSGELGKVTNGISDRIGKINAGDNAVVVDGIKMGTPDSSLHYVPFTYVGTVYSYNLENSDKGIATTEGRANELKSTRSLFVSNYNVSYQKSWEGLNDVGLIFGKNFNNNYQLRSLSVGSENEDIPPYVSGGTPTSNEWDSILKKGSGYIKNWQEIFSWGQDTRVKRIDECGMRGNRSDDYWSSNLSDWSGANTIGWRPVLEVMDSLDYDALKSAELNLNSGYLGTDTSVTSMNIVYVGDTFKAPSGEGLTAPKRMMFAKWQKTDDASITYEAGENVPSTVTSLTAQWVDAPVREQFTLPVGKTYYFDLAAHADPISDGVSERIGTINAGKEGPDGYPGLPDTTLHYVPFTYAGTVDAYSLKTAMATTEEWASSNQSERSLFVSDYNLSHSQSWNVFKFMSRIFGSKFNNDYTLRLLSTGSTTENNPSIGLGGAPTSNEWDSILKKDSGYIKNWQNIYSLGQDSYASASSDCTIRGYSSATNWDHKLATEKGETIGWRPALEVSKGLSSDALKAVTLDLNGGHLGTDTSITSIEIVCSGYTFKAPSATGLTSPTGKTYSGFYWKGSDDKAYEVGADVPKNVTSLTAQWKATEQFTLPLGETYYFDLSQELGTVTDGISNSIGKINGGDKALTEDGVKKGIPDVTLHYVPFTYVGTLNAYNLYAPYGPTEEWVRQNKSDRSLFVSDYNVSYGISWYDLHRRGLIFGDELDKNYRIRLLSSGSDTNYQSASDLKGTPILNEWDCILEKDSTYIKNWSFSSLGQDSHIHDETRCTIRGGSKGINHWSITSMTQKQYWRPALEVLNPKQLTSEGLKAVTINLNGGHLGTDTSITSMNIVCAGENFRAPSDEGLTRPRGNTDTYFKWNTKADGTGTEYVVATDVPSSVTTLYAQWEKTPASLTHIITATAGTGGSISPSGSVRVNFGETKNFIITPNSNYSIAEVKVDGVSQGNITSYTFSNVTANHTISASFAYNGGGSSSGGGSSNNDNDSKIPITPPPSDNPNTSTEGTIKLDGKVDSNGNATVSIIDQNVNDAYNKALADAKKNGNEQNGITLVVNINTGNKTTNSLTVSLPKTVQENIISKKIVNTVVVVDNPDIIIDMDLATVKEINRQAKADVTITVIKQDGSKLTGTAKTAIAARPVFDLQVNYGSGKQVKSFGTGSVTVSIPYTLGANEKAGNVQAVYVDENGKVQWLTGSVYDSGEKVVSFNTNHFSIYGVGYKITNTAFTDITNHWARENIEFVVSRGLFSGTSATTFSPNKAMTRGMFVTALGRLAQADITSYNQSSFTDVAAGSYYLGYVEWASKNGIVNGVGDNKFAPDQAISREQMAVIMANYARAIGFNLPKAHAENTFADNVSINSYAESAVKQIQMAGIISGKDSNKFDPQGIATRAEVSAVLKRFVELMIDSDNEQSGQ